MLSTINYQLSTDNEMRLPELKEFILKHSSLFWYIPHDKKVDFKEQIELFPFLSRFQRSFYMVGGTAIALHLGHRRSIS